jgi:recombination protein RecT
MSTQVKVQNNQVPATGVKGLSSFLNQDNVKNKFAEVLGQKANGFIASLLSAVNSNDLLKNADQNSIYMSAMMAASLDLPINSNLGHAYIIPFNTKQKDGTYKVMAQFQVSAKGFKQLAIRSGQFKYISDAVVYEGQLVNENPLTGFEFDWKAKKSEKIIGFVSYFQLLNGFESTYYMTTEEMQKHGAKYSKTFGQQYGLWKTDYEKMGLKTVTKLNLSKNAPLSIEMQRASIADQAVVKNFDPTNENTLDVETDYVDHEEVALDVTAVNDNKQRERIIEHIENAKDLDELEKCLSGIADDDLDLIVMYDDKKRSFAKKK